MTLEHFLGWALVHSVWEIALVAAGLFVVRLGLKRASARYLAAISALALCLILPVGTVLLSSHPSPMPEQVAVPLPQGNVAALQPRITATYSQAASATAPDIRADIDSWMPDLVRVWLLGVALMSLRFVRGIRATRRLGRSATADDGRRQALCDALTKRLGISRQVKLMVPEVGEIPSAIGVLKAVVFLPASAVTRLAPAQIEALIAHELAHVRRHDYLVNLLQTVLETVLFYHPAIWWISSVARAEREHCCDDLAIQVTGDRATYVRALAGMEELRSTSYNLAVAADGGSLLSRARRLLLPPQPVKHSALSWVLAGISILVLASLTFPITANMGSKHYPGRQAGDTATVSGRVVNLLDRPMPGVVVVLVEVGPRGTEITSRPTQRDGGFQVQVPPGRYLVHVFQASSEALSRLRVTAGQTREITLRLQTTGAPIEVPVQVIDANGRPAAHVRVGFMDAPIKRAGPFVTGVRGGQLMTDDSGQAVTWGTVGGIRSMGFDADGGDQVSDLHVRPVNGRVLLRLYRVSFGKVQGTVTDDSKNPLAGVQLYLDLGRYSRYVVESVRSNAKGRFSFGRVYPGVKGGYLDASLSGYANSLLEIAPLPSGGAVDVRVSMKRAGDIQGTVVDPQGRPMSGVTVEADDARYEGAVTALDGKFSLGQVSIGPHRLLFIRNRRILARENASTGSTKTYRINR